MSILAPKPSLNWLYLDLNSFFASVEQQLCPELRNKPVAVIPSATEATRAIAASYEAKAFGVTTGTMIYEARRMCPGLICVLARHERYVEFHHRIKDEIDHHIPITRVESIDEFACELMGDERYEARAMEIARAIKKGLRSAIGEYVRCSIGLSTNIFLAKTASNLQKPDGLTVLYPEQLPERLSHWSLGDLNGIGRNMERRLHHAGIKTIAELYALSPKQLRQLWRSVEGERLWYKLRGVELPKHATTRRTIGHSHVLAPALRPTRQAKHVARRLLMKAASRLRRMDYHCTRLTLSVRIENGQRVTGESQFSHVCDTMNLLHRLYSLWDSIEREYHPVRIKKIAVTLHGLVNKDTIQPELFISRTQQEAERFEQLSVAMDKINNRFGRDSVVIGDVPQKTHAFSGTKIAFTRIPDRQEFFE